MKPGVNYVMYGCSSSRTTPGASLYWSLRPEENIIVIISQDRVIDCNLKNKFKNRALCTCRLFLLT